MIRVFYYVPDTLRRVELLLQADGLLSREIRA
jgi:hypothetical protein